MHCVLCKNRVGILVERENFDYFDEIDGLVIKVLCFKLECVELGYLEKQEKRKMSEHHQGMTEKEKLFAHFFNNEKTLIKDMDDSVLLLHIQELQSIASEARARLTASAEEAQERSAKKKRDKGFSASVASDDFTSNAINNINERKVKMSKTDKEIERLVGLGIDRKDAENMYRSTTVKAVQKGDVKAVAADLNRVGSIVDSIMTGTVKVESRPVVNPFLKKSEEIVEEVKIEEVKIEVIEEDKKEESPTAHIFVNPFGKK